MPTIITHSVVGITVTAGFGPPNVHKRFWFLSILTSIVADADVIGFYCGIPYGHFFGHRGFFHSPFFGLLWSILLVGVFFRNVKPFSGFWFFHVIYFSCLYASHGILDAFTDGGLGIALLSPFDETRYFFPWRPIAVSPLRVKTFITRGGLRVLLSELLWVWLPFFLIMGISWLIRHKIVGNCLQEKRLVDN